MDEMTLQTLAEIAMSLKEIELTLGGIAMVSGLFLGLFIIRMMAND